MRRVQNFAGGWEHRDEALANRRINFLFRFRGLDHRVPVGMSAWCEIFRSCRDAPDPCARSFPASAFSANLPRAVSVPDAADGEP